MHKITCENASKFYGLIKEQQLGDAVRASPDFAEGIAAFPGEARVAL